MLVRKTVQLARIARDVLAPAVYASTRKPDIQHVLLTRNPFQKYPERTIHWTTFQPKYQWWPIIGVMQNDYVRHSMKITDEAHLQRVLSGLNIYDLPRNQERRTEG